MVRIEAWLLNGILGLMWASPIWMSTPTPEVICTSLKTLKDELNSTLRRRYLKHNFPINYTIQVHYEEVFRLKNISKLLNDSADVRDLQNLWFSVTETAIENIRKVLPDRHPTRRRYIEKLHELFKIISNHHHQIKADDELVYSESTEDIWERLKDQNYQGWKFVTPKSLLDNSYRTMHCLFSDCFKDGSQYDYCNPQHWRKRNGTQGG